MCHSDKYFEMGGASEGISFRKFLNVIMVINDHVYLD